MITVAAKPHHRGDVWLRLQRRIRRLNAEVALPQFAMVNRGPALPGALRLQTAIQTQAPRGYPVDEGVIVGRRTHDVQTTAPLHSFPNRDRMKCSWRANHWSGKTPT